MIAHEDNLEERLSEWQFEEDGLCTVAVTIAPRSIEATLNHGIKAMLRTSLYRYIVDMS